MARVKLQFVEGGSRKFWKGSTRGSSILVRFGRLGADGQTQEKSFPDAKAAAAALDKLVSEKKRKGYVVSAGMGLASRKAAPAEDVLGGALAALSELAKKRLVPARAAKISALEGLVGRLPSELRALYGLGSNLDAVPESDGGGLVSLETAIVALRDLRKHGLPATVVPLSTDGGGNFLGFDVATRELVDWDHETREATRVAGSLASHLMRRFVRPLRRDANDEAAIAKEAKKPKVKSAGGMPDAPTKLVSIANTLLRKLDRESYGGGIHSLAFLSADRVAIGFSNSIEVLKAGNKTTRTVYVASGALAYDPVSQRLFSAGFQAMAFVDAKSLEPLMQHQCDIQHLPVVTFSPDGALACGGDLSGSVNLYDAKGGKGLPRKAVKPFTPSYELPNSKPVAVLADSGHVRSIRFSPDGRMLSIATEGGVRLWNVATRKASRTIRIAGGVIGADFSPIDGSLVVGGEKGFVEVFSTSGKSLRKWSTRGHLAHLRVLANGFVAALSDNELQLFDGTTGKRVATLPRKRGSAVDIRPRIEDVHGDMLLLRGPAEVVRVEG